MKMKKYEEKKRNVRGKDELMAFYDFLAKHWQSLRTSNPIESTF